MALFCAERTLVCLLCWVLGWVDSLAVAMSSSSTVFGAGSTCLPCLMTVWLLAGGCGKRLYGALSV
jgi:hypothetical protein